jgi:hypothetical protein
VPVHLIFNAFRALNGQQNDEAQKKFFVVR